MDTITNFEEKYLGSKSVDPNQTVNFGASLNLTKAVEEEEFSSGVWNDMIWILTSSFIIFTMQTGEAMLPLIGSNRVLGCRTKYGCVSNFFSFK